MRKIINNLGTILLEMTKELGELSLDIALTPYGQFRYHNRPSWSTYYRSFKKLEKDGLLKKKIKNYKNVYILTGKGKRLLKKPKTVIERTDGFSTLIIFDIPETKSTQRQIFRRYLIRNGYTLVQKSSLVSRSRVTDELRQFVRELEIEKYISVFDVKMKFKL